MKDEPALAVVVRLATNNKRITKALMLTLRSIIGRDEKRERITVKKSDGFVATASSSRL